MRKRNLNKINVLLIIKWLKRGRRRLALAKKRRVPYVPDFVDYQFKQLDK